MTIAMMRMLLEEDNVEGFLTMYDRVNSELHGDVELTRLTQSVLPPKLKKSLEKPNPHFLLNVWGLIRTGKLLIVDNEIRKAVNERLAIAWMSVSGSTSTALEELRLFSETAEHAKAPQRMPPIGNPENAVKVRRVIVQSSFTVAESSATEHYSARRNVCYSRQEREFLKALRQFLPYTMVYPNMPLRNFIEVSQGSAAWSPEHRRYLVRAHVDVLLCTPDEDPLCGIELDSILHDNTHAQRRDFLKNEIFNIAGIPLIRIRADSTKNVRAEDFYALLAEEANLLSAVRPKSFRPRRDHDMLIPAG